MKIPAIIIKNGKIFFPKKKSVSDVSIVLPVRERTDTPKYNLQRL